MEMLDVIVVGLDKTVEQLLTDVSVQVKIRDN